MVVFEVLLNTTVCFEFLTNCPRTKYTPSSTVTADPTPAALDENVVADATAAA